MTASSITVRDAGKRFGDRWVLRNLDFDVDEGTIVGLIGPSGCGKTTTVRMVNGTYRPDEGEIETLGVDPIGLDLAQRQHIGYLPQRPVLFEALTLWENLNFHASLNGVRFRRRKRLHEVLDLVGLEGEEHKRVAAASGGMQRRLALAATLVHRPSLLVLDEPTAGIDPILRSRFWEHFHELADSGTTVIVTTQYVGEAAHCDVVGLLADGHQLHYATPEELRRAAYGGELMRLTTGRRLEDAELTELAGAVDGDVEFQREDATTVAVVVQDAGIALHQMLGWLRDRDIEVVDSEEVSVDYEDVFVRLVERGSEPSDGQSTEDREASCSGGQAGG